MHITLLDRLRSRDDLRPGIYARVSTMRQFKEGYSLERQVQIGLDALERYDIPIEQEMKIYTDGGISGTKSDRPDLNQLKIDIASGDINLLIVTTTDRVGRDELDNLEFKRFIMNNHAEMLFTHNPSLDIYTLDGEFQYDLDTVLSTREVRQIRKRAEQGIIQSFEKGNYASPGSPYGYYKVADKKAKSNKLNIKEIEADAVILIHDLYLNSGLSALQIVEYLKIHKIDPDTHWSEHRVRKILRNLVYCDIIIRNDLGQTFSNLGIAPILVTVEDKMLVLDLLNKRSRNNKNDKSHLFYQKVYCNKCNTISTNDTCKGTYKYYQCKKCDNRINEKHIEASVSEEILALIVKEKDTDKYNRMTAVLKQMNRRKVALNKLHEDGLISKKSLNIELKELNQERSVYLKQLSIDIGQDREWFEMSLGQKKKLIKKYIEKIEVDYKLKEVRHVSMK